MILIKRPIITEKSLAAYKNSKQVTFEVGLNANKNSIKNAVEKTYDVEVTDVQTITRLGKVKLNRKSRKLNRKPSKKFMVLKLSSKSKIEDFEGKN